ncbi:putative RNA2`-phosphotransferase [Erwinia phage Rebecca]|uniref:Putative RNA2`-phosphotransferase n=2 Tax=Agricanvirus ray TaxID=1984779 RepID=A0A482IFR8_9CAUD|nr:putative RNA2'-phosphotansferase [Erwinia phage vB_EamM_Bosolaphorus]QBP07192.1 putative RNA2`-phosphotransferase [Erwinia phage Rebecca]
MSKKLDTRKSMFLALVLRHRPEEIGITLDENGWVKVSEVITGFTFTGRGLSLPELEIIVETDEKKRYQLSDDKCYIRAVQGHSHESVMNMQLEVATPPKYLYHGTQQISCESIERQGILRLKRLYVHLTDDIEAAWRAATRKRTAGAVYRIDTEKMTRMGHVFYRAENGVWLAKRIPFSVIEMVDAHDEETST